MGRINELVQIPVQHLLELVERKVNPVVADSILGEVVRPDSFASLTRSDLASSLFGPLLVLSSLLQEVTTRPVGRCVIRTAESVVLTLWPPGPELRNTSIRRSRCSSTCTSTSLASGRTATVTVEVWMRPEDSVTGTRWTRCTPLSNLRWR
jgi:hypothetical protein